MSATLVMTQEHHGELLQLAAGPLETAAVILARQAGDQQSGHRLVVTAVHPVPEDAYVERRSDGLEIASDGYMPVLAEAARTGTIAIWTHTHPGPHADVAPSKHDERVNEQLQDLFALRTGTDHYAWLVLGTAEGSLTFTGALERTGAAPVPITRLNAIGSRLQRSSAQDTHDVELPTLFDRNIRALGTEVQKVVTDMTFAVVGCGGTGSAVAEQLVRLGARHLVLIDPDELSESNLTRVYGSTADAVGRAKVELVADHLRHIAPDLSVKPIKGSVNAEGVARLLLEADVIFGCTDDNAGRLRLSRFPYYYLVPLIDCGVLLDADADRLISGVFGRVTVVHPGAACLLCRDRVDPRLAAAELRNADEQRQLEREHYAPALPGIEPALVPFTTLVAAYAVSELLERLIGYGEEPAPSELVLRVHDRKVNANSAAPTPGHYCDPTALLEHDDEMFLGMNWTS